MIDKQKTMSKLTTLNETQLVILYQETNSPKIIGELYNRHHKNIVTFCSKIVNKRELAKDLTQDVFIKIFQKLGQLKEPHAYLKWMYQIARNTCMDFLRVNKKMKFSELTELENLKEDTDSYDDIVRKEEMIKSVNVLLNKLKPLSKSLLVEKYYGQKTIFDLSDKYGLSNSAVKMRLLRTKKRVETMYEDQAMAVA